LQNKKGNIDLMNRSSNINSLKYHLPV